LAPFASFAAKLFVLPSFVSFVVKLLELLFVLLSFASFVSFAVKLFGFPSRPFDRAHRRDGFVSFAVKL